MGVLVEGRTVGVVVVGVVALLDPEPLVVAALPVEPPPDVEEVLPGAEVEAAPGSWCATTPAITAAAAVARPVTHRAARLGRRRAVSRLAVWGRSEETGGHARMPPCCGRRLNRP